MPYLSSTLFFVAVVGALFASILGMLLVVLGLWPGFSARAEEAISSKPVRSMAFGLPALAAILAVSALLLGVPSPPARLLGVLVLGTGAALTLCGLTGVVLRVGRGLGGDARPGDVAVRRGATALLLAWLFPLLGWFVVLPLSLAAGLGAAFEALLSRAPQVQAYARAHVRGVSA